MSGMEPMLIGAALGGGISAARGGNPLKGALLGAVGGGLGGAALPAAPGAAGIFATPTMPTFAATGGSTGLIPSISAEL
ncbi:hypothetical protein BSN82_17630, partial [Acinetobacter baylyi]|uniref:hypothetical protein n=1 Tax=Acinetobacter baylyi TaxID=202950 RepID=UPI0020909C60